MSALDLMILVFYTFIDFVSQVASLHVEIPKYFLKKKLEKRNESVMH